MFMLFFCKKNKGISVNITLIPLCGNDVVIVAKN